MGDKTRNEVVLDGFLSCVALARSVSDLVAGFPLQPRVRAGPALAGFGSPLQGLFSLLQLQTEPSCLHHVYGFEQMNPAPVGPLRA